MNEVIDKLREAASLLELEILGAEDEAAEQMDEIVWENTVRIAKLAVLRAARRKLAEITRYMEVCNE